MTRKKFLVIMLCVVMLAGGAMGGYTLGQRNERAEWSRKDKAVTERNRMAEQPVIAVVNLDAGVEVNREQVYYGEKIIEFPDENFNYTSLEDARRGIEEGRYGAYIIIPSDFSESVESLNGTPSSAKIQYAVTENAEGDSQSELLQRVLLFGEDVNSQMSYMYLCNIMDEFHKAQDEAAAVMNNDSEDKAAIEQIQPSDLVSMVPIPELIQPEDTTRTADIAGYMQEHAALIENVDSGYYNSLEEAKAQLDELKEEGDILSGNLQGISEHVEDINLLTDETGQPLYQCGIMNLRTLVSEYNATCQKTSDDNLAILEQAKVQRQQIVTLLEECIADYNRRLSELSQAQIESYNTAVANGLPKLVLQQKGTADSLQYDLSCEEVSSMGVPPSVAITIEETPNAEGKERKECFDIILEQILSKNAVTTDDLWLQCDAEPRIAAFLAENGYKDTKEFLEGYIAGEISLEEKIYEIHIEGDLADIEQYMADSVKNLDFTEAVIPEFKAEWKNDADEIITFQDMMEETDAFYGNLEEGIGNGLSLDGSRVEEVVTEGCIQPLSDRSEEVKGQLLSAQETELELLLAYQKSIEGYAPKQDTAFLYENIGRMRENANAMQEEVQQSNLSYMDYADTVYTAAEENIMLLRDHLQEATTVSQQTVTEALAEAQRIKNETSSENQSAMSDFAAKLPYTRMGSMEYTQTYEFIANPTQMLPVSDYQRLKDEVDHTVEESDDGVKGIRGDFSVSIESAGYILFGILLLGILGNIAWKYKKRSMEQPAE